MSSHFDCVGFPVEDMEAYWRLARRAAAEGTRLNAADGAALARWAPGAAATGPEIWVQIDHAGEPVGMTPFFATGAPYRVAVTGIGEDPEEPMDGWIDGWLEPAEDDEPFSGAFPLRATLVDFAASRHRVTTFPSLHRVEIAALAHEADIFDNEVAYAQAPGDTYRIPVQSFVSAAHASVDEPPAFQEATALASGVITSARLLVNPVTEAPYWWVQFTVKGIVLHAFADRGILTQDPQTGKIISGSFWLVGRLI